MFVAASIRHRLFRYLALANSLGAANDAGLVERLTTYSVDEFDEWLAIACARVIASSGGPHPNTSTTPSQMPIGHDLSVHRPRKEFA